VTPTQRRLVRESFDAMRDQTAEVSLLFYGRLFELDPSARRLFHNDLALQARKIADTLTWLAESIDRFDSMRERLGELGRQHAGYGVRTEQYTTVTGALLWAFGHALGPAFDPPTREAWSVALDQVAAAMQEGAQQAR